jgi:hypothetical protein
VDDGHQCRDEFTGRMFDINGMLLDMLVGYWLN